jgi:hypothetical protein
VSADTNTILPRSEYLNHRALLRASRNVAFVVKHRRAKRESVTPIMNALFDKFIQAVEAFGEANQ